MNTNQLNLPDNITFLGTAGARFMVSRQLAASGGIWLNLGGTQLLLDPAPGTIVQANKRKCDPEQLSGIILSHRHLDHSGDLNVMVEAMTGGGFKRRGFLYAPKDALGDEPVIFSYLKKFIEGVIVLEAGKSYTIGDVTFSTPVRHKHPVETYGIVFQTPRHRFAYIADTLYFDELSRYYKADLIIINMVFTRPLPPVEHLNIADAARIITEIKPKAAILTHFGMHVWQEGPGKIAEELTQKTGVKVIAAQDGLKYDLTQLDIV
jgi:ribonuclease BN (tRNA processing enzyme)